MEMKTSLMLIAFAPLVAAAIAGLFGRQVGRIGAHSVTILAVGLSCILSLKVLWQFISGGEAPFNENLYTWAVAGDVSINVGFLVDSLTAIMMSVVTFVSLMVHIYTVGYMKDDPGYQRFFSYISLFTFSMLMLVMSNNFMQLFFGWEAVGLVSYLLIGFWYKKESAVFANLKAFMVNRVGDFGFLIGIAGVLYAFGSLDYAEVFERAPQVAGKTIALFGSAEWSLITVICIALFIGAMGKSAQAPLHVWLPDSMEGPTPISALIHAATMVTAGIFMVTRMSPLFEMSDVALSFVMLIGAFTAFFMGLIGIVQNDIKRVIAYSTLSQLGYMTVALGVSAYSAAIFHLMTHAFFKALLFLGAGSVIIAMHHKQDMKEMGGLRKYMPITFVVMWIGSLALAGFPGSSGFFSKDVIIEATHLSNRWGSGVAYWAVLLGVFVTALYSFRLLYLTFHGKERMDNHTKEQLKESPWVVTLPLILLAIPSIFIGWMTIEPLLFGGFMNDAIVVNAGNDVVKELGLYHFEGPVSFTLHGMMAMPFFLSLLGFAVATWVYLKKPGLSTKIKKRVGPIHRILINKYGFDTFNQKYIVGGTLKLGEALWKWSDSRFIDGLIVNGSAKFVNGVSKLIRPFQSGYVFHYALVMVVGVIVFISFYLF
ncbi:NADH-quinone oxidoreductase subunit L [Marinicella gelatinilytica]|uniref:NADH-quinone oxidoreductase subunit L n=1 Tax=Marinicella gelatinilytica TaxID=2996017 RepID=UPI002260CA28|nr:NADH-quinone oxidoreductase subunit L [Marinicella gelatinilytica]MCX7544795.1 NADH-quinone oxidoreductase subunit L [Marinicella gelatinilytica]